MAKSIFEESNLQKSNWKKWVNVGDSIQGTLISVKTVHNALFDKDQQVYELKLDDDTIWNVGSKPAIEAQMRHVKLGQIVGFRFEEQKKPAKPGVSGAKIIKVYANPKEVDTQWLAEQQDVAAIKDDEVEDSGLPFESETEQA